MKLTRVHFTAPVEFAGTVITRILCDRDEHKNFELDYDEDRGLVVCRKDGATTRILVPLGNVRAMEAEYTARPPATAADTQASVKIHRPAPTKQ